LGPAWPGLARRPWVAKVALLTTRAGAASWAWVALGSLDPGRALVTFDAALSALALGALRTYRPFDALPPFNSTVAAVTAVTLLAVKTVDTIAPIAPIAPDTSGRQTIDDGSQTVELRAGVVVTHDVCSLVHKRLDAPTLENLSIKAAASADADSSSRWRSL
jgi:hypothetical protein